MDLHCEYIKNTRYSVRRQLGLKPEDNRNSLEAQVGKKPAVHGGDVGFGPWPGKIPRATEQLSPRATTAGPVLWSQGQQLASPHALEPVFPKRSHQREKPAPCYSRATHSPLLEKSPDSSEDQAQPK